MADSRRGIGLATMGDDVMEASLLGIPDALTLPADALLDRLGSSLSRIIFRGGRVAP